MKKFLTLLSSLLLAVTLSAQTIVVPLGNAKLTTPININAQALNQTQAINFGATNDVNITRTGAGALTLTGAFQVTGALTGSSVTLSSLTSGRVTYATTGGQLTDSAILAFAPSTGTLTVQNVSSAYAYGVRNRAALNVGGLFVDGTGSGNALLYLKDAAGVQKVSISGADGSIVANSMTSNSGSNLTLAGGSSGASLVLGQGASGGAAFTRGSTAGSAATWTNGTVTSAMYLQSTGTPAGAALGTTSNHPLFFFTNSSGAQSVLTTTGNWLIGTTTDMSGSGGLKVAGTSPSTGVGTGAVQIGSNVGLSGNSGGPSYFGGNIIADGTVKVANGTSIAKAFLLGDDWAFYRLGTGDTTLVTSAATSGILRVNGSTTTDQLFLKGGAAAEISAINPGVAFRPLTIKSSATTFSNDGGVNIAATTSASSSTVGALTVGNGSAATNVAIGGGNINAGGTIKAGSDIFVNNGSALILDSGVTNYLTGAVGTGVKIYSSSALAATFSGANTTLAGTLTTAGRAFLNGAADIGGSTALQVATTGGGILVDSGSTSNGTYPALQLKSSGAGWGSGIQFRNTTVASNYGIYAGTSGGGTLSFVDNVALVEFATVTGGAVGSGAVKVNYTTPSTSTTTGSAVFGGGIGVAGALFSASYHDASGGVGTPAAGHAQYGGSGSYGASIIGNGSAYDFGLFNKNGTDVMHVATGGTTVAFAGSGNFGNSVRATTFGDSTDARYLDFTAATSIKINGAHLLWQTDNTYDIGASGATRPRNVYAAGAINAGGNVQVTKTTGASLFNAVNTGGTTYIGADDSTGSNFGTPYASVMVAGAANPLILGTSGVARLTISATGAATFTGTINAGGTINTTAATGNPTVSATMTAAGGAGQFPLFQLIDSRASGVTWNIENGRTLGLLSLCSAGGDHVTINGTTGAATFGATLTVGTNTIPSIASSPRAIFTHTATAVSQPTIALEGSPGGYGAGIDFVSALGDATTTFKSMAKIVSDGTGPWSSTASTQDANLTFWTSVDGSLVKSVTLDGTAATIAGNLTVSGTGTHLFSGSLGLAYAGTQKWHMTAGASNNLVFTRSGVADRMTLTSDGKLELGGIQSAALLNITGDNSTRAIYVQGGATLPASNSLMRLDARGTTVFEMLGNGNTTFSSTTSGTSTTAAAILGKSMGLTENLFVGGAGNFTGNSINFDPASGTPNFIFKEGGTTKGNIATSSGVMYVGTNQATNIVLQPNNTPQLTLSTTGATFAGTVNVASYGQFGGTGSELSGAGYFRVMSGFTKTDTSPRTIASFSSNDAAGSSYKMTVGMTGHATGAQRIVDLQTSNEGVANDGVLRLQSLGGVVSVGANGGLSGALFQLGGNSITSAGGMVFGTDTYLFRSGTSALTVSGSFFVTGVTVFKNYTVATLPAAASYTYGEAYVSDATQAAGTSIGSAPTGGGSVVRGVYSNGSAWLLR